MGRRADRRRCGSVRARGRARPRRRPAAAGCRRTSPLWVDYAGHDAPIVPKPGLMLALSPRAPTLPAQFRAAGAATIFFDLHLNDRVGTPSAPADPATIAAKAQKEFVFAQQVTGCRDAADRRERALRRADADAVERDDAQYRANVLALLAGAERARRDHRDHDREPAVHRRRRCRLVARRRAGVDPRPAGLLHLAAARRVSTRSAPSARAARCGRACAGSSLTSRRSGSRRSRVALELQFQSAPGEGGRQRAASPTQAWLEIVKLEALAAKQVARERTIAGDLVVGLAVVLGRGRRPRQAGGCMRLPLGARPALCDGPALAGPGFDTSLTEGQIVLPAGVRCSLRRPGDHSEERRRARRRAHRRPRLGGERAAPAAPSCGARSRSTRDGARRRAGDRARPLRRKPGATGRRSQRRR